MSTNEELFARAQRVIPGGVNSPVRAFKAVGGTPRFISRAQGAYMWDANGQRYTDYIGSWGPMILGHGHPAVVEAVQKALTEGFSFGAPTEREVELAEEILKHMPSMDMVRLVSSGTEAGMSALRLARGATGRSKFIKFEGCYHGHGDSFLIAAGSGVATLGTPDSPGVTQATARDTLTAVYNDIKSLEELFDSNAGDIACVIVEPVVGNMGLVIPKKGYLEAVKSLCEKHKALLIFDEVMTGFRLSSCGYQGICGIKPDLTTLGKIIGGGLPVGAYGGKAEIMEMIAPEGPVYQAGTLSGNPLATTAGLAMLGLIQSNPEVYQKLEAKGKRLAEAISHQIESLQIKASVSQIGSMFTLFFTDKKVENFTDAKTSDLIKFGQYFRGMLNRGIYLPPSQFESWFLSDSIGEEELEKIITASWDTLTSMQNS